MTDVGWGRLSTCESYGRAGDTKQDYQVISYEESKENYKEHMHASHGMIFAWDQQIIWDLYKSTAAILMQMRFDGLLGFPGGLIDPGEDPLEGLNRELNEEINLDLSKHSFAVKDHLISFLHEEKRLVLHFYAKNVPLADFIEIERKNLSAADYGVETLGILRPPLYTMGDGFRGFPAFLTNNFAGNAREELLYAIRRLNILSVEELEKSIQAYEDFMRTKST